MRNPRFQISDSEFWETEMDSLIFMIQSTGGCPSTLRNITKHVGMVSNSPAVSQHDFPYSMRFHGLTNVPWFRFLSRFYACLKSDCCCVQLYAYLQLTTDSWIHERSGVYNPRLHFKFQSQCLHSKIHKDYKPAYEVWIQSAHNYFWAFSVFSTIQICWFIIRIIIRINKTEDPFSLTPRLPLFPNSE